LLPNRGGVAFGLVHQNSEVECGITIATLETYFWLAPGATDSQIMKTFRDGNSGIRAIAKRKLLAYHATRLELTSNDFARP
jgi:hypothetical protein